MVVRMSNALNETRNDIQALRESFSTKGSSVSAELHETVAKELHETIAEIRTEMQEALASNEILKNLGLMSDILFNANGTTAVENLERAFWLRHILVEFYSTPTHLQRRSVWVEPSPEYTKNRSSNRYTWLLIE